MASPFQQRALQRKLIYTGLILVLFTASLVWRKAVVDVQAAELAIREQNRGEVDLLGAIVRLSTIGSRGVATCVTWVNAMDAQKKNQWNELELWVRTLTKMQPHFITPWVFQSWNLAYNVSVESDRVNDKYFYITRGVGLLAEGERQNRDNPDMRWSIGFFTQHKIGQSDETNTMRSLAQLSMIPPNERDPGRFWVLNEGRQEVNLKEFEVFCKEHPQLVRRLREGIHFEAKDEQTRIHQYRRQFRCERADEVVQFLADNFRVPSLWEEPLQPSQAGAWQRKPDKLRPPADRFPVLPPDRNPEPPQQRFDPTALTADSQLRDEHDTFQVARAWFGYAQEPIPQPDALPGHTKPITDPVRQHIPRHMMTLLFRTHPAQAQRFSAERVYDDGWFDESPWDIPDWFREQGDKFSDGEPARVGERRKWGLDVWSKTYEMWHSLGEANHLIFGGPAEQENMQEQAKAFAKRFNLPEGAAVPALREENLSQQEREEYFAWRFMREYDFYRNVSNFPHHYNRSYVETKEETVKARKLFFEAEMLKLKNSKRRALETYEKPDALVGWRDKVLLPNKEFRRDPYIQEFNYELQLKYFDLYDELNGGALKVGMARLALVPLGNLAGGGLCPASFAGWAAPLLERDRHSPLLGGPFDISDGEGVPLIPEDVRLLVLRRLYPLSYKSEPSAEMMQRMRRPTPPSPPQR